MPERGVDFQMAPLLFLCANVFHAKKTGRYLKSWDCVFVICLRHRFIKMFPFCSGLLGAETRENEKSAKYISHFEIVLL